MTSAETLMVYTVPSRWQRGRTATPYQRVVGLLDHDGDRVWTPKADEWDSAGKYSQSDAIERQITSDEVFKTRLTGFFLTYLVDKAEERFNCHRFGYWMSGSQNAATEAGVLEPLHIAIDGQAVGDLLLGQHGVIATRREGFEHSFIPHSIVGLGKGNPECIEVTGYSGYMAISPYDSVNTAYSVSSVPKSTGYGLYAL